MELRGQNKVRPRVEQLEDRVTPTTLTVHPHAVLPAAAAVPTGLTIGAAASAAQATHSGGVAVIK
jgi:hypothetical protein